LWFQKMAVLPSLVRALYNMYPPINDLIKLVLGSSFALFMPDAIKVAPVMKVSVLPIFLTLMAESTAFKMFMMLVVL
jgi:hypothetical protein